MEQEFSELPSMSQINKAPTLKSVNVMEGSSGVTQLTPQTVSEGATPALSNHENNKTHTTLKGSPNHNRLPFDDVPTDMPNVSKVDIQERSINSSFVSFLFMRPHLLRPLNLVPPSLPLSPSV